MARVRRTFVLAATLGLALVVARSAVGGPEPTAPSKEALASTEVRLLLPLLRTAVKEDFRRQAWYFATRILGDEPKNQEAEAVLRAYKGPDLEEGREPTKAWLSTRDAALKKVGDAYAAFARDSQAVGAKAIDTFAYAERAIAFGTSAADAIAAMANAGYAWRGTYGSVEKGLVETALGTFAASVTFPSEFDDTVLRYRCVWPDARAVEFGKTRLISALSPDDTWHTVALLSAEEACFVRTFGSKAKDPKDRDEGDHTDLVVAPDASMYSRLGDAFVQQDERTEYEASSSWYRRKRLLLLAPIRDNAWTGRDAAILGQAARPMVRRHLGVGASSWIRGRGSWFLDGFVGAFEGFVAKGPDTGDVDPERCWRLAAMREIHERAAFVPWDELFSMDAAKAADVAKRDVSFSFGGEKRDGKQLSVPTAQATALVLAIWQMDGGKGAKKLAVLCEDIYKRNGLPDIDKALGVAPGKTVELTEKFLRGSPPK